jgi:hypothetical protein
MAVPHFVIDAPGGGGKIPLLPEYLQAITEDEVILRNYAGKEYRYPLPKEETQPSPAFCGSPKVVNRISEFRPELVEIASSRRGKPAPGNGNGNGNGKGNGNGNGNGKGHKGHSPRGGGNGNGKARTDPSADRP